MFYSKKTNRNWFLISSAMVGGFALGVSYKKYGPNLQNQIKKLRNRDLGYEDYMASHGPDV